MCSCCNNIFCKETNELSFLNNQNEDKTELIFLNKDGTKQRFNINKIMDIVYFLFVKNCNSDYISRLSINRFPEFLAKQSLKDHEAVELLKQFEDLQKVIDIYIDKYTFHYYKGTNNIEYIANQYKWSQDFPDGKKSYQNFLSILQKTKNFIHTYIDYLKKIENETIKLFRSEEDKKKFRETTLNEIKKGKFDDATENLRTLSYLYYYLRIIKEKLIVRCTSSNDSENDTILNVEEINEKTITLFSGIKDVLQKVANEYGAKNYHKNDNEKKNNKFDKNISLEEILDYLKQKCLSLEENVEVLLEGIKRGYFIDNNGIEIPINGTLLLILLQNNESLRKSIYSSNKHFLQCRDDRIMLLSPDDMEHEIHNADNKKLLNTDDKCCKINTTFEGLSGIESLFNTKRIENELKEKQKERGEQVKEICFDKKFLVNPYDYFDKQHFDYRLYANNYIFYYTDVFGSAKNKAQDTANFLKSLIDNENAKGKNNIELSFKTNSLGNTSLIYTLEALENLLRENNFNMNNVKIKKIILQNIPYAMDFGTVILQPQQIADRLIDIIQKFNQNQNGEFDKCEIILEAPDERLFHQFAYSNTFANSLKEKMTKDKQCDFITFTVNDTELNKHFSNKSNNNGDVLYTQENKKILTNKLFTKLQEKYRKEKQRYKHNKDKILQRRLFEKYLIDQGEQRYLLKTTFYNYNEDSEVKGKNKYKQIQDSLIGLEESIGNLLSLYKDAISVDDGKKIINKKKETLYKETKKKEQERKKEKERKYCSGNCWSKIEYKLNLIQRQLEEVLQNEQKVESKATLSLSEPKPKDLEKDSRDIMLNEELNEEDFAIYKTIKHFQLKLDEIRGLYEAIGGYMCSYFNQSDIEQTNENNKKWNNEQEKTDPETMKKQKEKFYDLNNRLIKFYLDYLKTLFVDMKIEAERKFNAFKLERFLLTQQYQKLYEEAESSLNNKKELINTRAKHFIELCDNAFLPSVKNQ